MTLCKKGMIEQLDLVLDENGKFPTSLSWL